MSVSRVIATAAASLLLGVTALTQGEIADPASKTLPNPNPKVVKNFGMLPDGRMWGNTAGVDIGPDGQLWAYDRCGTNSCAGSNVDPIVKFDRNSGKLLASFGRGQFIFPHGIHVDRDGNVWVTDGRAASKEELAKFPDAQGKGHTVTKFSPDGKVLMTARQAGRGAARHRHVQRAERRDHGAERRHLRLRRPQRPEPDRDPRHERPHREVHEGRQVRQGVGQVRLGPGEFRTPHALAMDSRGRLFVADRGNHRIQIFDQDGKFLEEWKQFSRVSGLFITRNDSSTRSTRSRAPSGIRTGRPACASARRRKTRCCSSSRRTRCRRARRRARPAKAWRSIPTATSTRPKVRSRARRPAAD